MGRRDDIIDAALSILSEEGARGLTLPALFERVGTGSGTFYHYFKGIDVLIQEVFVHCSAISQEALREKDDPSLPIKERFFLCVKSIFNAYVQYPREMNFLYWYAYGYVVHNEKDPGGIPSLDYLIEILQDAQKSGLVAVGVTPVVEARMVRGLIASAMWGNERGMFADDPKSLHVFTKACWRFVGGQD